MIFKEYRKGKNKGAVNNIPISLEEAKKFNSYGGTLKDGLIDISFDTDELSQKFWDMAEQNNWNCFIQENPQNGHLHSFWRIPKNWSFKDGKDITLAVGLIADIHHNGTYIPIKVDGNLREFIYEPSIIDEVPFELFPIKTDISLLNLKEHEGRNEALYRYILRIRSELGVDKEVTRHILKNTNTFVFAEPLSKNDVDTVLRDDAFPEDLFFIKGSFQHSNFAMFLKNNDHVKRIDGQLQLYRDGVYVPFAKYGEEAMIKILPNIKHQNRTEVTKYLEAIMPDTENIKPSEYLIAFDNGVLDIRSMELLPFSPEYLITNKIPWNYDNKAYSELLDQTLDIWSCEDKQIRLLLEELIGYCLYRENKFETSFILTGSGANGKSTFLETLTSLLGNNNVSHLDFYELDDRFSTVMLAGKLANIGDDISDEFLGGKTLATFKKITSSNSIKAEYKGQQNFFFKPKAKLIFSSNTNPKMKVNGFSAIKRRIKIIPFNATFTNGRDVNLRWKLQEEQCIQYLINLGIAGLIRVLNQGGFTESAAVESEIEKFEKENNPILTWLEEVKEEKELNDIFEYFSREPVSSMYDDFCSFCIRSGERIISNVEFSKALQKHFSLIPKRKTIKNKKYTFLIKQ